MVEKSSIMIDLDDPRSARIGEIIGNKTAKRVLGVLADGERSESEIASELELPMNTIGYNVRKLEEAGLIEKVKGFLWSVKGKRIHKYRVVNRRIVISPRAMIKGVVPSVLICGLIAAGIKMLIGVEKVSQTAVSNEAMLVKGASEVAGGGAGLVEPGVANAAARSFVQSNVWAWFLLGALVGVLIVILWNIDWKSERRLK